MKINKEKIMIELEQYKMWLALARFDFKKIIKTMSVLNWYWSIDDGDKRTPTQEEMEDEVIRLCQRAYEEKSCISCGGFEVDFRDNEFYTRFIAEESDSQIS